MNKEQILEAWEKTREAANRLADAKADYVTKLGGAPDLTAFHNAMTIFRADHAETKRRREAEFLAVQQAAKTVAVAEKDLAAAKKSQDKAEKEYHP